MGCNFLIIKCDSTMIQISEPAIVVAIISVVGAIITAAIGASKYGKRKAETNLFNEFRISSTQMQESYRETIVDLRSDKLILKKERDDAVDALELFKLDFNKMKDMVQENTTQIALMVQQLCLMPDCQRRVIQ